MNRGRDGEVVSRLVSTLLVQDSANDTHTRVMLSPHQNPKPFVTTYAHSTRYEVRLQALG